MIKLRGKHSNKIAVKKDLNLTLQDICQCFLETFSKQPERVKILYWVVKIKTDAKIETIK